MSFIDINVIPEDYTICEIERIKQKSNKAILIDFGDCEHWVPTSLCVYGEEQETGMLLVAIKDWKYKELGL